MVVNANFDQYLTTTLANYRKTLTDNVFKKNVLSDRLLRAGQVRQVDGGTKIVEPLIHAENDTVTTYSGWDQLDLTPQTGISASEWAWQQFAGSVAINGREEAINNGSEQMINLLEAKVKQLDSSLARVLNRMLHGSTAMGGGNYFTSLVDLIGTTNAIGGIDGNVNSFWRSIVTDASAQTAFTEPTWATAVYSASDGIDGPDFGLTTISIYQAYEQELMPNLRYTSNNEGDARFRNLMYLGMPLFHDVDCEAGTTYFLNEENINLVTHSDRWMKPLGFRQTPDVDGRWSLVVSMGNLTANARRGSAKVTGQTAL